MIQGLYTAASGLTAQQKNIDVIASNLANVNTNGYKSSRADFKESLARTLMRPRPVEDDTVNLQVGTGVQLAGTVLSQDAGPLVQTDRLLDFSLTGEGYFTLEDANGQARYTRDGAFYVSPQGGYNWLVSADGYYVMDTNNQRIRLPADLSNLSVDDTGLISVTGGAGQRLQVVTFGNPGGLLQAGGNTYVESENSGAMAQSADPGVRQGALEGSNVSVAREVTRLVRAQRAYQLASRAVSTADEMESTANRVRA